MHLVAMNSCLNDIVVVVLNTRGMNHSDKKDVVMGLQGLLNEKGQDGLKVM